MPAGNVMVAQYTKKTLSFATLGIAFGGILLVADIIIGILKRLQKKTH